MSSWLPRMGRIAGAIVTAFELRAPRFGQSLVLDAAERFFHDDPRASDEKRMEASRAIASALVHGGVVTAQALGVSKEDLPQIVCGAFVMFGVRWNSLAFHLESAPPGMLDPPVARTLLAKLSTIDLALRAAGFIGLTGRPHFDGDLPDWAPGQNRGAPLRAVLDDLGWKRARFAGEVGVWESQADAWLDGAQLPRDAALDEICQALRRGFNVDAARAAAIERDLREHCGLSRLVDELARAVGTEATNALIREWASLTRTLVALLSTTGEDEAQHRSSCIELVGEGANAVVASDLVRRLPPTAARDWADAREWVIRDWFTFITRRAAPAYVTASADDRALEDEARTLIETGREDDGLRLLRAAVDRHPDRAATRLLFASWLGQLGRHARAVEECWIAAQLEPDSESCQVELAVWRSRSGHVLEASATLQQFLERRSRESAAAWYHLGALRELLRDWPGVIAAITRVVDDQPENGVARDLLAHAYLENGDRKNARVHALRAWQLGFSRTWARLTPEKEWELEE